MSVLRGTEIAQARVRLAGKTFHKRGGEPRFPDAGLAREQHRLAFPSRCRGPAPKQQFGLFLPPDEGGQAGPVQRLEAARHRTRPHHRPGPDRPVNAVQVPPPKVVELEEIAEKPSRAFGDDDLVRSGDALQACRKVRRLANDAAFLSLIRSDQGRDVSIKGSNVSVIALDRVNMRLIRSIKGDD